MISQAIPRQTPGFLALSLAFVSPYMTRTLKRFGDYHLDLGRVPEPWSGETVLPRRGPQRAEQGVLPFPMEA